DDGRGERSQQQLTLDGDVDDADSFAQHTGERTEDDRNGERECARGQVDHRHAASGTNGCEECRDEEQPEDRDPPDRRCLPVPGPPGGECAHEEHHESEDDAEDLRVRLPVGDDHVVTGVGPAEGHRLRLPEEAEGDQREDGEDGERDGRLPVARRERDRWCLGQHLGIRCRHLPASSVVRFSSVRDRVVRRLHALLIGPSCTGFGRRKIALTSGGAAMKSTMTPCTTSSTSGETSAICMAGLPAFMAPNSSPAKKMPTAPPAPSRATVIPSKPMPASMLGVTPLLRPSTWLTPATPTNAALDAMAMMYTFGTLMPAVLAACAFMPTARNRNPMVERSISHQ